MRQRRMIVVALPSVVLFLFFFLYIFFNIRIRSLVLSSSSPTTVTAHTNAKFSILIGILTRPDSYDRRHFLRLVYGIQSSPVADIDVKFVFCNLTKKEQRIFIALEILRFNDIITLNCTENMNNGKTYTYFSSLPQILPRKYDYVMKADDDVFIRLEPLSLSLKPLPRLDLYYGFVIPCNSMNPFVDYMSGMGFLLSWDVVEWIGNSPIPANATFGPEDKLVGNWLKMGNKGKNRFSNKPGMYDYPGTNGKCSHELIPETVAVHRLKRWDQWLHVLEFFNVTQQVNYSRKFPIIGLTDQNQMGLEGVGDLALHIILTKLGPKDTARVACVSKRFRDSATEEALWSLYCSQDLNLSAPLDADENPVASFKEAYGLWRVSFCFYPWPLVLRVKRCWDNLKSWLAANFPEALATLQKGVAEADIQKLEKQFELKLPLPARLLFRFCGGQDFSLDGDVGATKGARSLGLIGGYSFYGHMVDVFLLPFDEIISYTEELRHHLEFFSRSKFIVVAASATRIGKFFFLDCATGQLFVGTKNLVTGEMLQCVPQWLVSSSVHDCGSDQPQDAMLLWLEEHFRRLQNGIIKLREEGSARFICQFPETSPLCSTAVTNGVQVRASAVLVPELTDLNASADRFIFSYSIRMSLLPDGCFINGMYFSSCQLHWRHWIIRANNTVVSNVNGEAVIGMFPLLQPGEKEFVYESCTPLPTSSGSVEGSFTFVPGRLRDPKGGPFEVEVAQFPLQLPDYIF
ncbi:hypothetical protein Tsubulata_034930 [Turnera subulata]|uniref:ApaG domain-containing protein n=1 Tax=Turnera subulata TaxID=218843 RepID=A0A9Q0JEB4_9ROSI|nr:hypothetical protein Tsubulata_034930 [Turnera subulata]